MLFLSVYAWSQDNPYNQQSPPDQQSGYGQQPYPDSGQPDPQQGYGQAPVQPLNAGQLEQLVAPIALYPDALVAQVLGAATYPSQVADADRWRQAQGYASPDQIAAGAEAQNWDPSVKALTAFPQVLAQMDRNLQWTTALGNAYYNQPQDVLEAVQVMRRRAQAAGNLQSTPQEEVRYDQGNIELAPVNPQVVYVPAYNPWTIYGSPISPYPGFALLDAVGVAIGSGLRFGLGIAMNAFLHTPFGWLAWGLNWLSHAIFFHNSAYYSHSTSVADWGFPHYGFHAYAGREGFGRFPDHYARTRDGGAWRRGGSDRNSWHEFSRAPETHAGNWENRNDRGSQFENRGTPGFSGIANRGAYNHGAYDHEAYNRAGSAGRPGTFNHPGFDHPGFDHAGFDHAGFDHAGFDRGYEGRSFGSGENRFAEQSSRGFGGQTFSTRNSGFLSKQEKSGGHHWFGGSHAPKSFGGEKSFGGGKGFGGGKAFGGGKNFGAGKSSGGHHSWGGGHSGGHGGGGKHHR